MFRYYVSFSFQNPSQGFGIASLDINSRNRISSVDDLMPITANLTSRGYVGVKILAFSLYADPTPPPAPTPRPTSSARSAQSPQSSRTDWPRRRPTSR